MMFFAILKSSKSALICGLLLMLLAPGASVFAQVNEQTPRVEIPETEVVEAQPVPRPDALPAEVIIPAEMKPQDSASVDDAVVPRNPAAASPGARESTQQAVPQVPVSAQSLSGGSGDASSGQFPLQPLPSQDVVSATRTQISGSQVGSALTVISSEMIRNSGQVEVAEVLRSVAGVDVNRSGGAGQLSSVFIRGANGNQTKVLLDGMSINDVGSAGGAFDFSFLSVDEIDRIEVLRGPQSTLYGSDAIGGVVNIITKRGSGPLRGTASVMGGTYATSREAGAVSGGTDRFYYSLGASYLDTNGFSAASRPPGNVEADGYSNGTISSRLGWNLTENLNVDVVLRHTNAHTGIDFGFGLPQDDPSSVDQANTFARVQATLTMLDGMWTHRFGGGYTQYDRVSNAPFGGPFYGRSGRVDWQQDMVLVDADSTRWVATSGVDYHEDTARNADIGNRRQDNLGGFVLLNTSFFDQLYLTGGGRWDDYTFFGSAFTYRTTARWEIPGTSTAAHASLGTGFRAPALAELFDPFVGSVNLRPERSKGWDVGFEQRFADDRLIVDATYFRNDLEDLIIFDFGTFLLENVGSGLASGVELTSLYRLDPRTTLFANYTFTDTRNRDTGLGLLRRPRDKWSLGWNRSLASNRANFALTANYVGDRVDTGNAINESYWRVDMSGWYRLNDRWRLFSRVDNLLDEDYEETLGFNATRFAFYGGAEWAFGPGRNRR